MICNYLDKGSLIGVDGKLQTGTYEKQDGTKGYTTDVYVQNIEFLESKKKKTEKESSSVDPYAMMAEQIDADNFLD